MQFDDASLAATKAKIKFSPYPTDKVGFLHLGGRLDTPVNNGFLANNLPDRNAETQLRSRRAVQLAQQPGTTADQRVLIAIVSTHFATRFLNSAPYNFL